MEDTISRQAAINISKELQIPLDEYHQHNHALNSYAAEIMKLPQAEPEKICVANITLTDEQIQKIIEEVLMRCDEFIRKI